MRISNRSYFFSTLFFLFLECSLEASSLQKCISLGLKSQSPFLCRTVFRSVSPLTVRLQEDVVSLVPSSGRSWHSQAGCGCAHHGNWLGGMFCGVRLSSLWENCHCEKITENQPVKFTAFSVTANRHLIRPTSVHYCTWSCHLQRCGGNTASTRLFFMTGQEQGTFIHAKTWGQNVLWFRNNYWHQNVLFWNWLMGFFIVWWWNNLLAMRAVPGQSVKRSWSAAPLLRDQTWSEGLQPPVENWCTDTIFLKSCLFLRGLLKVCVGITDWLLFIDKQLKCVTTHWMAWSKPSLCEAPRVGVLGTILSSSSKNCCCCCCRRGETKRKRFRISNNPTVTNEQVWNTHLSSSSSLINDIHQTYSTDRNTRGELRNSSHWLTTNRNAL